MLIDLQKVLLRALTSDAPLETLKQSESTLSTEDRAAVGRIDPEGFLLTSLLVRKLRFERICRGDAKAEEWFAREPERFTEIFRAYNRDVPPVHFFPRDEAAAFREWVLRTSTPGPTSNPL